MRNTETVLQNYISAALWSSMDDYSGAGGNFLDENYGPEDIAPDTLESMRQDVAGFIEAAAPYDAAWSDEQLGHDIWLTRNRHGAGFWDRGLPHGDKLTEIANCLGESYLYVGDDGKIHAE